MKTRFLLVALACAVAFSSEATAQFATPTPPPGAAKFKFKINQPDKADVAYGPNKRQKMDIWLAQTPQPAPVLVNIHGNFMGGEKIVDLDANLTQLCLLMGITFVSINVRTAAEAPYPAPMHDAARAIQFLRANAAAYHIDPKRFVSFGHSCSGGMALWVGLHPDLADPRNSDPVLRQSSRVSCVFVTAPQTTYDPRWIKANIPGGCYKHPFITTLFGAKEADLDKPNQKFTRLFDDANLVSFVNKSSPPVFIIYGEQPQPPLTTASTPSDGICHKLQGLKLKEAMDAAGVECTVFHPADWEAQPAAEHPNSHLFLRKHLDLPAPK